LSRATSRDKKPCYGKDNRAMRPTYECLQIVCKRKISRRLRKNLHISILSLFGGEIIFEVLQPMRSRYLNVTVGQTDGRYTVASPRLKTKETKCRRYYPYRRYLTRSSATDEKQRVSCPHGRRGRARPFSPPPSAPSGYTYAYGRI